MAQPGDALLRVRIELADVFDPQVWRRVLIPAAYPLDWEHAIVVEARQAAEDGGVYPACVAGEGACPPEDCGGSPDFAEFKAALAGPPGTERDALLQWAGRDYDPVRFDVSEVNAAVSAIQIT